MASYNRVILMGNLTRDPELKYLPSNVAVCEFGLAINHRWRDRDGNQRDEVCFVDVSIFGKGGETINQYMSKGRSILIEGRLKLDTWTAQDGSKRSKHSIIADNFQFVGAREGGGGGDSGGGEGSGEAPSRGEASRGGQRPAPRASSRAAPQSAPHDDAMPSGDDIPF